MSDINVEDLVKKLSSLTILEAADLAKKLEEEWGVSAAMPAMAAAGAAAGNESDAADEKSTTCLVMLKDVGSKKINVVKEVRAITELGLFDAKALVDNVVNEPQQIKQQMPREEAEEIKKKLEAIGATVDLVSAE